MEGIKGIEMGLWNEIWTSKTKKEEIFGKLVVIPGEAKRCETK